MNAAQTERRAQRFPTWSNVLAYAVGGFGGVELGDLARTYVHLRAGAWTWPAVLAIDLVFAAALFGVSKRLSSRYRAFAGVFEFASTCTVVALAPILLKIFGAL